MAITIKDIAKIAGVSRGTVDRALNNRGQISPGIKSKILQIAQEYGYKKNILASRLALNEEVCISVVLPHKNSSGFWKEPLIGIEKIKKTISDYGIKITYHHFDSFDHLSFSNAFQEAIESRPQAILIAPIFLKESLLYLKIAQQNKIPVVCINSEIENEDIFSYVGQDSFQSGMIAGKLFDLKPTKQNEIVILTLGHNTNNAIHIQKKIDGLKSYNLINHSNYKIFDYVIEDFKERKNIQRYSELILKTHKNLKGLFFTNSRAHQFLNHSTFLHDNCKNINIIGFDLLEENIKLLTNNKIDFLLNQNPIKQGYLGVLCLFNHFIYNKAATKTQYLPTDIIIKENYTNYLEDNIQFLDLNI